MKVYTADEVAGMLKVSYKTVLRLIQRGDLTPLPGLRHIRITEAELCRYLGVASLTASPRPSSGPGATPGQNESRGDVARAFKPKENQ